MTYHNKLSVATGKHNNNRAPNIYAIHKLLSSFNNSCWSLMPLLGIAIKCEVFMVTGLPFKEVIKQHQRMGMCKYTHCVVTLSWSKHSSNELTWIHTHTHTQTKPIGQQLVQFMHYTYSDVQYEHITQLHNKISVYRVSLKGHSCLMCSHNAARTLSFLPINAAVKRVESFHEWKVKLIENATWPDQNTLWTLITELMSTFISGKAHK